MSISGNRIYVVNKCNRPYAEIVRITEGKHKINSGFKYHLPNNKNYKYLSNSEDHVLMQYKYLKEFRLLNNIMLSELIYRKPLTGEDNDFFYFHPQSNTFFKRLTDSLKEKIKPEDVLYKYIFLSGCKAKLKIISEEVSLNNLIEQELQAVQSKKKFRRKVRIPNTGYIGNIIKDYIRIY